MQDLSVIRSELTERQDELSSLVEERNQLNSTLISLMQKWDSMRRSECGHVTVAPLATCVGSARLTFSQLHTYFMHLLKLRLLCCAYQCSAMAFFPDIPIRMVWSVQCCFGALHFSGLMFAV